MFRRHITYGNRNGLRNIGKDKRGQNDPPPCVFTLIKMPWYFQGWREKLEYKNGMKQIQTINWIGTKRNGGKRILEFKNIKTPMQDRALWGYAT